MAVVKGGNAERRGIGGNEKQISYEERGVMERRSGGDDEWSYPSLNFAVLGR